MCLVLLFTSLAAGADVRGVVTDQFGKPIRAARIDHIGTMVVIAPDSPSTDSAGVDATDARGRFHVTTKAPAAAVRKPGYRSQRLLIRGDETFNVVLRPIIPRACEVSPPPKWQKKPANDVDYTGNVFVIETKEGKQGIMSGRGGTYSLGAPSNNEVWTSVDYDEVMYPDGVVDARGHTAAGKYWRSKTIFGAAAFYFGVDAIVAKQLDCVMNTIDLMKP